MKKHVILITAIGILLLGGWLYLSYSQESKDNDSQLTIPWEEFKKLLNLEAEQISLPMETFQKLLAQTGISIIPAYTISGGNVILTREEFKKLVDHMKPPAGGDGQPPFDYLITKAVYSGKMAKQTTTFNGIFTVHVLKRDAYLRIPLLPQNMALEDVKVEGKAALVVSENGFHQVVLSKPGEYTITASFSIKTEMERGPHKMDLYIQQTPITLLNLDMPLRDIDVEIPQAQQLSTSLQDHRTLVSAVITPGQYISIQWRKKLALTEKIPPKLYSEIYHLISIDDDALRLNSDVTFNILHSEIDAVRFLIPENMNILTVTGEGVGEWQESVQDNRRLIMVPFTYSKKGGVVIRVTAEVPLSESGLGNIFTGFRTLETVRETGFMGVELNTSAEVTLLESESVEKVPPQKLPDQLVRKSLKPLIMGFKYLRHPYNLILDVKKHEKIAVPVATINNANIVTLFTEDGKVVHRLIYQVRNSAKQFLEIQLPADADVWSVFVDNQPVEASLNQERKLLVPLIRSREVNNQLETFPVEVILALSEKNFSGLGSRGSALPAVDLLISQLIWSVYLPNDYSYNYFTSTLEKEEIIRGLNIFSGAQRRYNEKAMREILPSAAPESDEMFGDKVKKAYEGKDAESRFKNVPMEEHQLSSQMAAEMEFSGRMEKIAQGDMGQPSIAGGGAAAGFLPIMIQIPTNGQVYRFAKTIIKPNDPLLFNVVYSQMWLNSLLKWLVLIVIILIIYWNRRRLQEPWNWLKEKFNFGKSWYEKYQDRLKKIAGSLMTPFILFGLVIVFWPVSVFLTIVFLFLLWVSIVYQVLYAFRRRKERMKIQPEPEVILIEEEKKVTPSGDKKNS
jgi:hypothetical protein